MRVKTLGEADEDDAEGDMGSWVERSRVRSEQFQREQEQKREEEEERKRETQRRVGAGGDPGIHGGLR